MNPQQARCVIVKPYVRIATLVIVALMFASGAARAQHHVHKGGLPHDVPDFAYNPTNRAVKSGPWSAAGTWSAGRPPAAGDVVRIPTGITVTYDVASDAILESVGVEGSLTFRTDLNTRLVAGVIQVMPSGTLEVGRAGAPVAAGVTAEIVIADRALDPSHDPAQFGTALIGFGTIRMHGAVVEPTFVRLAEEPAAGQTALTLQTAPVSGWQSARLILPGTNQFSGSAGPYQPQWEELAVTSVSGARVQLETALAHHHRGARDADGGLSFLPHVGNLSRNVVIRSANPRGTRGHAIFVHRADVDIRYSLFKDLGRTTFKPLNPKQNHIGRYSLHMHHVVGPSKPQANGHQFTLIGNAIDGGSKWGITVHNAHYGLIRDNVIYDVGGAGIMTEDGSETGNVFDHNFVVRAWGTGAERADDRRGAKDFGYEGSAFWFRGPNNFVRNNVGANSNSFAVTYMMLDVGEVEVPSKQGADPSRSGKTVNMMAVPLLEFTNNEVYASRNGLTVWNLGANCCSEVYEVPESRIDRTTLWHIGSVGYSGYSSNRVIFDGWVQRGDTKFLANPHDGSRAFDFGDYLVRNTIIRNADIQGLRLGILLPFKIGDTRDIYGNKPGTLLIENSVLKNVVNIRADTMYGVTGGGVALPPRQTTIRGVRFGRIKGDVGGTPQFDVLMSFNPEHGPNANVVVGDEVWIYDYNNTPGDSFRVYYTQQAPSFRVPPTGPQFVGAPVPGLTNAESWERYKVAIAGSVAPCVTERPGFGGFTCTVK
ncbi:MAG TPA: G8 domain-containing protein [Vicinamibacterales bacterium]|nr:G8 domain-containing protein [Vicinamibacterales bacterium]